MTKRTTDGQVEQTTSALEEVLCNGARELIREAVEGSMSFRVESDTLLTAPPVEVDFVADA